MTQEQMLKRIQELENELAEEKRKHYETNKKLNEALEKLADYQQKYDIERIKQIIPKSEKIDKLDHTINEVEETIQKEKKEKSTNKGKKYKKVNFDYESHVSEIRYIDSNEETCEKCGEKLVYASQQVRYVVEVQPAKVNVIKLIKRSKKCPKCNRTDNKLYYPIVHDVFNGSILTPSLSSFIMYHKYELGIPFHHLSSHLTNSVGFEISKQNLANYMAKTSQVLEPIYEKMRMDLLNNEEKVLFCDETTLVVSKKDDANKDRKKSYVFVYTSSFYSKNQIRIYDFHESRKVDQITMWLSSFNGVIHCDDYSGYDALKKQNNNIKLQRCWAHVRRRFADIVKSLNESQKKDSYAFKVLQEISKLFILEAKYKRQKKNPIQILQSRKLQMPPIIENIKKLIFGSDAIKGSALENAINYAKDCFADLLTFMENGYVELTNNVCERAVKPFVVQRKVFQTSGSYAGARYTSKLFSIIQTCKINNVNVEKYIEYVLNNINNKDLKIDDLTPYSNHILKSIK